MHPVLSPLERARRFQFCGEDCLYRDHLGRRVIADVEGHGICSVESAECPLVPVRDEEQASGFLESHQSSMTVLALGPGEASVLSLIGREQPVSGPFESVRLPHKGCGWVLAAEHAIQVDGRHQRESEPGPSLPIPFFRCVEGRGTATIVSAQPQACTLVDEFSLTDAPSLEARQFVVQNVSKAVVLDSCFPDGTRFAASVISHLNAASWDLKVPAPCDGLILRKTYDRFHGRQRARVLVDGAFAGWWYEPAQDRLCRWHETDFGIGAPLLEGKSRLRITVDPPPGAPLWSVSKMQVWAITRP